MQHGNNTYVHTYMHTDAFEIIYHFAGGQKLNRVLTEYKLCTLLSKSNKPSFIELLVIEPRNLTA